MMIGSQGVGALITNECWRFALNNASTLPLRIGLEAKSVVNVSGDAPGC